MKSTGRPYQGDDLPKIKFLKMSKTKELWPKMGQKWSKNDFRAQGQGDFILSLATHKV